MKNQKGGAIFALLAGLIASAVAGATQIGGGVKKRKPKKESLICCNTKNRLRIENGEWRITFLML